MTAQSQLSSLQPISSRWRRLSLQQKQSGTDTSSVPGRRRSSTSTTRASLKSLDSFHSSTEDDYSEDFNDINFIGCTYAADVAYLDQFLTTDMKDLSQVTLHSFRNRSCDARNFEITYYHALRYRGEIVWILETVCRGDGKDIQGEVSTCSISEDGCLRVRITHKTSSSSSSSNNNHLSLDDFGGSQHSCPGVTREKYMLDLSDILLRSAEAYQEISQYHK